MPFGPHGSTIVCTQTCFLLPNEKIINHEATIRGEVKSESNKFTGLLWRKDIEPVISILEMQVFSVTKMKSSICMVFACI